MRLCPSILLGLALALPLPPVAMAGVPAENPDAAAAVINGHPVQPAGSKTYGPEIIKPDDLKWCLANIDRINAAGRSLRADKARLQAEADAIKAENAELTRIGNTLKTEGKALTEKSQEISRQRAKVDKSSKTSVDAYNASLKALRGQNAAYQAQVQQYSSRGAQLKARSDTYKQHQSAYNSQIDVLNKSVTAFSQRCSNKNYYTDDMAAARKK
jgi:chromosome segregation ATPase